MAESFERSAARLAETITRLGGIVATSNRLADRSLRDYRQGVAGGTPATGFGNPLVGSALIGRLQELAKSPRLGQQTRDALAEHATKIRSTNERAAQLGTQAGEARRQSNEAAQRASDAHQRHQDATRDLSKSQRDLSRANADTRSAIANRNRIAARSTAGMTPAQQSAHRAALRGAHQNVRDTTRRSVQAKATANRAGKRAAKAAAASAKRSAQSASAMKRFQGLGSRAKKAGQASQSATRLAQAASSAASLEMAAGAAAEGLASIPGVALAVAKGFYDVSKAARELAEKQLESNRYLAQYNAVIARSFAVLNAHDVRRNVQTGYMTQESTKRLAEAMDRMRDDWQKTDAHLQNFQNRVGEWSARGSGAFGRFAGEWAERLDRLSSLGDDKGAQENAKVLWEIYKALTPLGTLVDLVRMLGTGLDKVLDALHIPHGQPNRAPQFGAFEQLIIGARDGTLDGMGNPRVVGGRADLADPKANMNVGPDGRGVRPGGDRFRGRGARGRQREPLIRIPLPPPKKK